MISKKTYRYCKESISLIENYESAVSDKKKYWVCHHRKGIELDCKRDELIKLGLYYNRPANELQFLTKSEHMKIHNSGEHNGMYGKPSANKGKTGPMLGKHHTPETRLKLSLVSKEYNTGKNNYQYKDICPLQLYVDKNICMMSIDDIADKYKCSKTTIYRRLKQTKQKTK